MIVLLRIWGYLDRPRVTEFLAVSLVFLGLPTTFFRILVGFKVSDMGGGAMANVMGIIGGRGRGDGQHDVLPGWVAEWGPGEAAGSAAKVLHR
jgi:hypothetical protein